jgi:protocatechuate 3,4-dioxygenase beta subunit
MSDHDDKQIGRILSRREVLVLLGGAGIGALIGCASGENAAVTVVPTVSNDVALPAENAGISPIPACVVRPEMTEGPYFVDEKLDRSNIRSNPADGVVSAGVPLTLNFLVSQVGGNNCTPLPNAIVDVWHCDAFGVYSDVENAVGQQFLRGFQTTNADGIAQFTTIYPGWYRGRAVHIHFKIRTADGHEFTSQLFFDEALTEAVYQANEPYAGSPDTPNSRDGIFRNGGDQLLLNLTETDEGYATTFDIGLNLS